MAAAVALPPPTTFPSSTPSSSTLHSSSSNTNSPALMSNNTNGSADINSYASSSQVISNATALLNSHAALLHRVRLAQEERRKRLVESQTITSAQVEAIQQLPLVPASSNVDRDVYGDYDEHEHEEENNYAYDSEDEDDDIDAYDEEEEEKRRNRPDLPPAKRARVQRYKNYVPEEETIRNDYSQRYVDGGEWPQNWVLGAEPERRFEEYPKQQRLLQLKKASVNQYSLPPTYIPLAPTSTSSTAAGTLSQTISSSLASLHPSKFDVILIDPPYSSNSTNSSSNGFTWDNLQELPIPSLAADPSFVFLWVGSGAGEGLERGREVLAKWGYRRCEDVVWVRTNKEKYDKHHEGEGGPGTDPPTTSLLTRTKQHCLMGIRGTVRRSTDSWFVHCNVDTDVIIWEGDPLDPTRKPPEMYTLIENFCLGMRRLEIFGKLDSSLRRGWVTALAPGQETGLPLDGRVRVADITSTTGSTSANPGGEGADSGKGLGPGAGEGGADEAMDSDEVGVVATRWNQDTWEEGLRELTAAAASAPGTVVGGNGNGMGKAVVPMSSEIDALRPKSPVRPGQGGAGSGGGGGGGNGGGGGGHHQFNGSGGGGRAMGVMAQPMATPMSMSGPRFGGGNNNNNNGGGRSAGGGGGFGNMTTTHAVPMGMTGMGMGGGVGTGMGMGMNPSLGMGMNNMGVGMGNMGMGMGNMGMGVGMGNMGMGMGSVPMGMGMSGMGVGGMGMGTGIGNSNTKNTNAGVNSSVTALMAQPMGSGGIGGGVPLSIAPSSSASSSVNGMDDMVPGGGMGMGMGVGNHVGQNHTRNHNQHGRGGMTSYNGMGAGLGMGMGMGMGGSMGMGANMGMGAGMGMGNMPMNMNPAMMLGAAGGGGVPSLQNMGMGMGMGMGNMNMNMNMNLGTGSGVVGHGQQQGAWDPTTMGMGGGMGNMGPMSGMGGMGGMNGMGMNQGWGGPGPF